jgi:CheY-like chemotaxis protein
VSIFLPVAKAPEAAVHYQDPGRPIDGETGRRVLLVDDEEMVLEAMRRALTAFGHKPTAIRDATAALGFFKSVPRHFDLAIVDQSMPRMSGLELASELRKLNPGMPILLATGYSKAATDKALQDAGVTAVIMKPLSLKDLGAAVSRALASAARKA